MVCLLRIIYQRRCVITVDYLLFIGKYNSRLLNCRLLSSNSHPRMTTNQSNVSNEKVLAAVQKAIPPLLESKYKGQAGRIGVVGGSKEYTGAPYFAAISALKTGCDLSHVFCASGASQVIKSYSPELIVHPLLNQCDAIDEFLVWLPRLHSLVIGPGLGRDSQILATVKQIILKAKEEKKHLVIDADGLWLVTSEPEIVMGYSFAILTPNAMEFVRLYRKVVNTPIELSEITSDHVKQLAMTMNGVTINVKGRHDVISDGEHVLTCSLKGSLRRCGGQGDLLSGSLGTFAYWMHLYSGDMEKQNRSCLAPPTLLAAFAACSLTRTCSRLAFEKKNRHMTTSDMVEEIPRAFKQLFTKSVD